MFSGFLEKLFQQKCKVELYIGIAIPNVHDRKV